MKVDVKYSSSVHYSEKFLPDNFKVKFGPNFEAQYKDNLVQGDKVRPEERAFLQKMKNLYDEAQAIKMENLAIAHALQKADEDPKLDRLYCGKPGKVCLDSFEDYAKGISISIPADKTHNRIIDGEFSFEPAKGEITPENYSGIKSFEAVTDDGKGKIEKFPGYPYDEKSTHTYSHKGGLLFPEKDVFEKTIKGEYRHVSYAYDVDTYEYENKQKVEFGKDGDITFTQKIHAWDDEPEYRI